MAKLTSQEVVDLNKEYTFFSWSNQGQVNPIPMERAQGPYFWDMDGKRYLDFASQLVNTNVGHQHPKVVKAIQDQAAKLTFAAPGMATEPRGLPVALFLMKACTSMGVGQARVQGSS